MQSVNIAELKNNLSASLEQVKNGEELIVKDRNRPIARLVLLTAGEDLDAKEMELAADSLIRPPAKSLPDSFRGMPPPHISTDDAVSAITSDHDQN